MTAVEKRIVSLPAAQASYIDALVRRGAYASSSEVVRAGLRALQERDAVVDRWLREAVAPVADAMAANPARGIAADEVARRLRARLRRGGNPGVTHSVLFAPEAETNLVTLYDYLARHGVCRACLGGMSETGRFSPARGAPRRRPVGATRDRLRAADNDRVPGRGDDDDGLAHPVWRAGSREIV